MHHRHRPYTTFLPRQVRKWLAQTFAYFWIPCPECDEYFAGYEWDGTTIRGVLVNKGICWKCRNRLWAEEYEGTRKGVNTPL